MSSRPFESPPPYRPDEYKPSIYAPSQDMYGAKMASQPAYSYYPEDEVVQHFYKWSSPPGIIKIMAILIVVMCVGIFACVASTLPWDLDITGQSMGYGMGGYSSYSPGFSGYGFGGQGVGYGFAYGGSYTDPRAAKGFILAMSAFCFICGMVIFAMSVTRTHTSTTRRFYLIVIIISGIMAGLVLIATIVYIMGVNPVAQASGSSFYNQILSLCQQFYAPVTNAVFVNQYLYHYCVVEPQEAIAIVLGFLIVVAFAIIIFFAVKTRRKINNYGKSNILWQKTQHEEQGDPNVEEWVKNVSTNPEQVPAMSEYNEKVNGSIMEHRSINGLQAYSEHSFRSHPRITETVYPMKNEAGLSPNVVYSSSSDASKKAPRKKRPCRARRSPNDYDTDYTTGGESGEELEDDDFESEYPPITSDQQRQDYKREFDANLQEYKGLQAELEDVSRSILQLDRELDEHPEGSQSYKAVADEYNRLKDIKSSADYKNKRNRCKLLKAKLNHIKGMVSDYDRGR